jgi:hypothetical protein
MRKLLRTIGLFLARLVGTRLTDFQTGRDLGKALIIPWRGKVHVVGLETAVRAVFLPQKRLTYWKQEIGFTTQPPPDYPNERSTSSAERDHQGSN